MCTNLILSSDLDQDAYMFGLHERSLTIDVSSPSTCKSIYTQTKKLWPLDVYVCQFHMYERISFKFSPYKLWSFKNDLHLREIHLIISVAADKAVNTSTLKIKSLTSIACVSVIIPNRLSTFKHH